AVPVGAPGAPDARPGDRSRACGGRPRAGRLDHPGAGRAADPPVAAARGGAHRPWRGAMTHLRALAAVLGLALCASLSAAQPRAPQEPPPARPDPEQAAEPEPEAQPAPDPEQAAEPEPEAQPEPAPEPEPTAAPPTAAPPTAAPSTAAPPPPARQQGAASAAG